MCGFCFHRSVNHLHSTWQSVSYDNTAQWSNNLLWFHQCNEETQGEKCERSDDQTGCKQTNSLARLLNHFRGDNNNCTNTHENRPKLSHEASQWNVMGVYNGRFGKSISLLLPFSHTDPQFRSRLGDYDVITDKMIKTTKLTNQNSLSTPCGHWGS